MGTRREEEEETEEEQQQTVAAKEALKGDEKETMDQGSGEPHSGRGERG